MRAVRPWRARIGVRVLACAALAFWGTLASAASSSLVGQLDPNNPQDVLLHPFTLTAPGTVTIQSWGYGGSAGAPGGVNAAGAAIAGGGFDPYVSLFAGSGPSATFLASNDDGNCPPGAVADALCGDSTLVTAVLPAGSYTLAVSAFLNMSFAENLGAGNLGDGFIGLGSYGTRTSDYAVDISGATVAATTLQLSHLPNGLTFGPQTVGVSSGPMVVVVTNTGSGAVNVGALTASGPDAALFAPSTTCGGALAPGATCTVSVVFSPVAAGPASASLSLASSASNAPNVIALGGTGTADPVAIASLSAVDLDFGTWLVGSTSTLGLVVTNTGGAGLVIGALSLAGSPDFTLLADGCSGQIIAASGTCAVTVRFAPTSPGVRAGAITIPSNASNSPTQVALRGTGAVRTPATPVPALSPTALGWLSLVLAVFALFVLRRARPVTRGVGRR